MGSTSSLLFDKLIGRLLFAYSVAFKSGLILLIISIDKSCKSIEHWMPSIAEDIVGGIHYLHEQGTANRYNL